MSTGSFGLMVVETLSPVFLAEVLGMGGAAIESLLASRVEAAVHDLRHTASAATRTAGLRPTLPSQMAA